MADITKNTTIGQGETLEEAAMVHGINADDLMAKIAAV